MSGFFLLHGATSRSEGKTAVSLVRLYSCVVALLLSARAGSVGRSRVLLPSVLRLGSKGRLTPLSGAPELAQGSPVWGELRAIRGRHVVLQKLCRLARPGCLILSIHPQLPIFKSVRTKSYSWIRRDCRVSWRPRRSRVSTDRNPG